MIQVKEICKTYISKTKQEVKALKGVNFELGNSGMVFILGKSGSGKSTLLNMLGGLDTPTSGEIIIDGVSMKQFKSADYEQYRNGYVGFIFQEYNLLDDFNVRDNVALALQMNKGVDVNSKVIEALQQVQLSEEYLTRHPDEMSGGEKQRVAISRAIVKDCHLLLADEPTGNLDSRTGESVWNILKDISKTKLVVVVSHDRESAEKYADRILEIADGSLISDNGVENSAETAQKYTAPKKKHLPFKVCLKMAVNSILQRKIKTVSVVLLAVFCIVSLLVTQMCAMYSPEKALARAIRQDGVPYVSVQQGSVGWNDTFDYKGRLQQNLLDYVQDNSFAIVDGIVENRQQVLDFGLTFVGEAHELDEHSYYVTKQALEDKMEFGYYLDTDGEGNEIEVGLVKGLHTVDFLIGKRVYLAGLFNRYAKVMPILAGVIDTDAVPSSSRHYLPNYFARADFEHTNESAEYKTGDDCRISFSSTGKKPYVIGATTVETSQSRSFAYGSTVMTMDVGGNAQLQRADQLTLADDEIVMSFGLYRLLYLNYRGDESDYIIKSSGQIVSVPDKLGQTVPIRVYERQTDEFVADLGKYKIAGILFSGYGIELVTNATTLTNWRLTFDDDVNILVKTDSVRNLSSFLADVGALNGFVAGAGDTIDRFDDGDFAEIVYTVYTFANYLKPLLMVFGLLAVILLVLLVLLLTNLISFSIADRRKEIGILSALGTFRRDVCKIFIFETLIISLLTVVFSLAAVFGVLAAINNAFSAEYSATIPFLGVDAVTITALFALSVGILLLATLIPLRKINRMKPVDALRII